MHTQYVVWPDAPQSWCLQAGGGEGLGPEASKLERDPKGHLPSPGPREVSCGPLRVKSISPRPLGLVKALLPFQAKCSGGLCSWHRLAD